MSTKDWHIPMASNGTVKHPFSCACCTCDACREEGEGEDFGSMSAEHIVWTTEVWE